MSVTPVINKEKVKNLLDAILKNIQTEADPHLLNQYRSLIRKNVSFFRRSYLAAYLLMLQEQPQNRKQKADNLRGKPHGRNNSATSGSEPGKSIEPARQGQRPAPQTPAPIALPEDEAVRLFISIGRNRRVFPREILGLIGSKTSVAKEDIGTIAIMNNYSFVQVRNSVAEELIEALDGVSFRGKTLAVNYARTRKEEDEDPAENPLEESALPSPEQDSAGVDAAGPDAPDTGAYAAYNDAGGENDPVEADASGNGADE